MLQEVRPGVPVISLHQDFSMQEAGDAGSWLLQAVRSHLERSAATQA
jgi:hypothetical protein